MARRKSSKKPLFLIAAFGAGLAALSKSKTASAAETKQKVPTVPATTPPAAGARTHTTTINGHTYKLVQRPDGDIDAYAPAGSSWGNAQELLIARYRTIGPKNIVMGVGQGVPEPVLKAAMTDLKLEPPSTPVSANLPSGQSAATGKVMPTSLQAEMLATMTALGVDATGVVRGPVSAEAVRRATELSSRLDQAGFPEAAAAMRNYAQQAGKMLPQPANPAPAIPGVPAELMAQIQRALELERDPAKLELLRATLAQLPQSPQRDLLLGALDALILQVRAAQAVSQAATAIDERMKTPAASASSGTRILKLVTPNMTGADVADWQRVLIASGYSTVKADGVFGPATDAATTDWQRKRGLPADGDVGPLTRAKIGTPPTAPLAVPSSASPQPDPKPKTATEVAADALATHLLALQVKHGVPGSKGRQDMALVKRFQSAVGGVADGLPGPNTMIALAKNGVGILPAVMYWPKNATKARDLPVYRSALGTVAQAAGARGNATLQAAIQASAARETGLGGLK